MLRTTAARKIKREACEEEARKWAELERRRKLARARQEREAARLRLRRDGDGQVGRFRDWTRARLLEIEPRVFPDQTEDELHDPLGEPPPPPRWY